MGGGSPTGKGARYTNGGGIEKAAETVAGAPALWVSYGASRPRDRGGFPAAPHLGLPRPRLPHVLDGLAQTPEVIAFHGSATADTLCGVEPERVQYEVHAR